jgi:hypothetical protein
MSAAWVRDVMISGLYEVAASVNLVINPNAQFTESLNSSAT